MTSDDKHFRLIRDFSGETNINTNTYTETHTTKSHVTQKSGFPPETKRCFVGRRNPRLPDSSIRRNSGGVLRGRSPGKSPPVSPERQARGANGERRILGGAGSSARPTVRLPMTPRSTRAQYEGTTSRGKHSAATRRNRTAIMNHPPATQPPPPEGVSTRGSKGGGAPTVSPVFFRDPP